MFFTVCIPTLNRFDNFLCVNLPKYIENPLVNEIIITDETGDDIEKITKSNIDKRKLKLYKNQKVLGPFLNKLTACRLSSNEWIALIDSDNFADERYFTIVLNYIKKLTNPKYDIISPCFAKPRFNYTHLSDKIISKNNLLSIFNYDNENRGNKSGLDVLMNTGNYVINKTIVNELNISKEVENIKYSSACDVIYFNTLLFEQLPLNIHVVKNLEYEHCVHADSIYIKTHRNFQN